jgi:aspartate aminotransferase
VDQRIVHHEGGSRGGPPAPRGRRRGRLQRRRAGFPDARQHKNAAIEALRQNFTKYTPVSGTVELKQTICDYHKRTYGTSYNPKECIATVGGKHAIFNLVQALVDPGDEVIIPVP